MSAGQFSTTLICVGACSPCLTIRNRWPSGEHIEVSERLQGPGWTRTACRTAFSACPRKSAGCVDDIHGHHLGAAAEEKLAPVAIPHRLGAAVGGNLPLPSRSGIRLHVYFKAAGFIGNVSQPAPVGRKLRRPFDKRCAEEGLRLAVRDRQHPDVPPGAGGINIREGQQLPIRGPGTRRLLIRAGGQPFPAAAAIRHLPEDISSRVVLGGSNRDALAIRCPNRKIVATPPERSAGSVSPG